MRKERKNDLHLLQAQQTLDYLYVGWKEEKRCSEPVVSAAGAGQLFSVSTAEDQ